MNPKGVKYHNPNKFTKLGSEGMSVDRLKTFGEPKVPPTWIKIGQLFFERDHS